MRIVSEKGNNVKPPGPLVTFRQRESAFAHNPGMDDLHKTFVDNLHARRKELGMTQQQVAAAAGMSNGFLSEILSGESAPGLGIIGRVAKALRVEPWEMLADGDATRQAALQKLLWGERVSNEKAAEHLPPAPKKEVAAKRIKKGGGGESPPH